MCGKTRDMKEIKAYQCDYCKLYKKTKSYVKEHEDKCYLNPKNRACATCKHNVIEIDYEGMYIRDQGGDLEDLGDPYYNFEYNWCEKKEVELKRGTLKTNCDLWEAK